MGYIVNALSVVDIAQEIQGLIARIRSSDFAFLRKARVEGNREKILKPFYEMDV